MKITVDDMTFDTPDLKHPIYDGMCWEGVIKEYISMGLNEAEIVDLIKRDISYIRKINLDSMLL